MSVVHVGAGQGTHFRMVDGDHVAKTAVRDEAGAFEVFEVFSQAGPMTPPHVAPWSGVLFLLEGRVVVHADGTTYDVAPGGLAVLPAGTPFTFEVVGESAHFLAITSGDAASRFFADLSASVAPGAPMEETLATIREVTARHGVEIAGAPAHHG